MTRKELDIILGEISYVGTLLSRKNALREGVLAEFGRLTDGNQVYQWYVNAVEHGRKLEQENKKLMAEGYKAMAGENLELVHEKPKFPAFGIWKDRPDSDFEDMHLERLNKGESTHIEVKSEEDRLREIFDRDIAQEKVSIPIDSMVKKIVWRVAAEDLKALIADILEEFEFIPDTITDGYSIGSAWCPDCEEKTVSFVRPGKVQCSNCG